MRKVFMILLVAVLASSPLQAQTKQGELYGKVNNLLDEMHLVAASRKTSAWNEVAEKVKVIKQRHDTCYITTGDEVYCAKVAYRSLQVISANLQ